MKVLFRENAAIKGMCIGYYRHPKIDIASHVFEFQLIKRSRSKRGSHRGGEKRIGTPIMLFCPQLLRRGALQYTGLLGDFVRKQISSENAGKAHDQKDRSTDYLTYVVTEDEAVEVGPVNGVFEILHRLGEPRFEEPENIDWVRVWDEVNAHCILLTDPNMAEPDLVKWLDKLAKTIRREGLFQGWHLLPTGYKELYDHDRIVIGRDFY